MGGFFGAASLNDCINDVFSALTIIRIWAPSVEV